MLAYLVMHIAYTLEKQANSDSFSKMLLNSDVDLKNDQEYKSSQAVLKK